MSIHRACRKASSNRRRMGRTFVFPIDPEMLVQRIGYACMDEDSFPFNSVDSEEADSFYDQTCTAEKTPGNEGQCHYSQLVNRSCVKAVEDEIGKIEISVRYERLAWDAALAESVRYGEVTGGEPDLKLYLPDFLPSRITCTLHPR